MSLNAKAKTAHTDTVKSVTPKAASAKPPKVKAAVSTEGRGKLATADAADVSTSIAPNQIAAEQVVTEQVATDQIAAEQSKTDRAAATKVTAAKVMAARVMAARVTAAKATAAKAKAAPAAEGTGFGGVEKPAKAATKAPAKASTAKAVRPSVEESTAQTAQAGSKKTADLAVEGTERAPSSLGDTSSKGMRAETDASPVLDGDEASMKGVVEVANKSVKSANVKTEAPTVAKAPAQAAPVASAAARRPLMPARPAAPAAPAAKPAKAAKDLGFKTNEFIVYPAHGVGEIIAIEEQEVAGYKLELFVISFIKDKMILKVPLPKIASVGMRKLADGAVVKRALDTLTGRARVKRTMWSRRAQEYEAKINSGSLVAIAEVVRDLYRSEAQPEQSYSERQLYEAALDRMAREIAAVQQLTDTEALKLIDEQLRKGPRRGKAEEAEPEESDEDVDGDMGEAA
jgi:CarD family transcriptional regulator